MHTRDLLAPRGSSAPIPPRPPAMFEALEERLLLNGVTGSAYEVWGGFTDYRSDPDAVYLYCNIDQQDYDYLGPADATDTFVGEYDLYVIAANHPLGVDAVEGSDGSFAPADPASGYVRDPQYIAGPPDGQSAVVGNVSYPGSYRGYAIVENPGPWTSLTVHTTPLPPQVLELIVVRESAEYNDEGQWTAHWYGVNAGGIDLEGMTITTPWGDYIDSADYLPGQWGGELVETFDFTYGVWFVGRSEGPERFIEVEWDDLPDTEWNAIETAPAQIDVTYTGGSWAASVDSATAPIPLDTPNIIYPQNWDYDVPLDAVIQWDPWSIPPIGEGVEVYFEGEMGPGSTTLETFLPPQASTSHSGALSRPHDFPVPQTFIRVRRQHTTRLQRQ